MATLKRAWTRSFKLFTTRRLSFREAQAGIWSSILQLPTITTLSRRPGEYLLSKLFGNLPRPRLLKKTQMQGGKRKAE
jgi:hypothetical protein